MKKLESLEEKEKEFFVLPPVITEAFGVSLDSTILIPPLPGGRPPVLPTELKS